MGLGEIRVDERWMAFPGAGAARGLSWGEHGSFKNLTEGPWAELVRQQPDGGWRGKSGGRGSSQNLGLVQVRELYKCKVLMKHMYGYFSWDLKKILVFFTLWHLGNELWETKGKTEIDKISET